jgi:hypothetical protein
MEIGWHGDVRWAALSRSESWRKGAGQLMGQGDDGTGIQGLDISSLQQGIVGWDTVGEVWETGADRAQRQVLVESGGNLWGKHGKRSKHILASMLSG